MYAAGDGVPEEPSEAARWYRIAAERGHWTAQRVLAAKYLAGTGVPKNEVEGLAWLNVAATSGREATLREQKRVAGLLPIAVVKQAEQRGKELAAEVTRNRKGRPSPPDR